MQSGMKCRTAGKEEEAGSFLNLSGSILFF